MAASKSYMAPVAYCPDCNGRGERYSPNARERGQPVRLDRGPAFRGKCRTCDGTGRITPGAVLSKVKS